MLSFFPRGVLDEILNLIESVSEGFPSYSPIEMFSILQIFLTFVPPVAYLSPTPQSLEMARSLLTRAATDPGLRFHCLRYPGCKKGKM